MLPQDWDSMRLRHVKAFGKDFDITVTRKSNHKVIVEIDGQRHTVKDGETLKVTLK